MTLSVLLCTVGRPGRLRPLLADLVRQLPSTAEVLVIDQSLGAQAVKGQAATVGLRNVRWTAHAPAGLPGARNRGIAETSGSILWFIDDDIHIGPGCVDALLQAFTDPTVGGVVGRIQERRLHANSVRIRNDVGRDGRVRTHLNGEGARAINTLKGAHMAFRRTAVEQAGPFDLRYGGTAFLEDADLSERVRRLGWTLLYEPRAAVVHDHDTVGGVRQDTARATLGSRFENTGFFVGRYRPVRHLPLVMSVHAGVALRHGIRTRDAMAPGQWMSRLLRGWWRGRNAQPPRW